MKNFLLRSILLLSFAFIGNAALSTELTVGQVAVTSFNSDGNDSISFVLLTEISDTTTIYITDRGWDSTSNDWYASVEGTFQWTFIGNLPCGTEIAINVDSGTASHGMLTESGNVNLAAGGDALFFYHGDTIASVAEWLFGFNTGGEGWQTAVTGTTESTLPLGLTDSVNAIGMEATSDNWQFNCAVTAGPPTLLLAALVDENNWTGDNSTIFFAPNCGLSCVDLPVLSVSSITHVSCNGDANGSVSLSVSSGSPAYSYFWSATDSIVDTAATIVVSGLAPGNYTVTVVDAANFSDTVSVTITGPDPLQVSITVDSNVTCAGDSNGGLTALVTGGTSPYTYGWDNGDSTASVTGLSGGNYFLFLTDSNGCTALASGTVSEPAALSAVIAPADIQNVSCNSAEDGSLTVTVTGGTIPYNYLWSNGDTVPAMDSLVPGVYDVTITDANGCVAGTGESISQPDSLVLSIQVDSNASCSGMPDGGLSATVTGGTQPYQFLWNSGDTMADPTGLPSGVYSLTVTDANGCAAVGSDTITAAVDVSAFIQVDSAVGCFGAADGALSVVATGGTLPYGYQWSTGTSDTMPHINDIGAGTYQVTVTDNNGCFFIADTLLTEPALLMASIAVDSNVTCAGLSNGGLTAMATGGTSPYVFDWGSFGNTASIAGLAAGTYTVTITDSNNCPATATDTVSEPPALAAQITVINNVSCNGEADGGLMASAMGGTGALGYLWSNAETTPTSTGLTAGSYSVTVTDSNGCTTVATGAITEPLPLVAVITIDSNVACHGDSSGGMTVMAAGGTAPYFYQWDNWQFDSVLTHLEAGAYSVTITDDFGCSTTGSDTILQPDSLQLALQVGDVTCNGDMDGELTAIVTGGAMPYGYSWSNGGTVPMVTGLPGGNYAVTITDANGCGAGSSATVVEPAELAVNASILNVGCESDANGAINLNATGGTPGYEYDWSTGSSMQNIANLATGDYWYLVMDAHGCAFTDTVNVGFDFANPVVDLGNDTTICANTTLPITTPGIYDHYIWSTGSIDITIEVSTANSYSLTVQDVNGCFGSDTILVAVEVCQGISEAMAGPGWALYPNPTTGQVVLEPSEGAMLDEVLVLSMQGEIVYRKDVRIPMGKQTMDLRHLAKGTYVVQCVVNGKSTKRLLMLH